MINLKISTAAAAMALLLPMAAPTESFAQNSHGSRTAGGVRSHGAVHANRGAHGLRHNALAVRLGDDTGCHDRGAFISGSVAGGVGFCDNGYYER